jgi:hypothetical protein
MNTKYALVNNIRTEAEKGLTGVCPFCSSAMIAKCGNIRMKHWAHKSLTHCDSWFERETEWHRQWKNHFDASWQEFIFKNKTSGEKHIADVHTEHGLVIEFQHSPIDTDEQNQREQFYENMIWVVDGSRLKRDYIRFHDGIKNFQITRVMDLYLLPNPKESFPINWVDRAVPVVIDFKGLETFDNEADLRNYLFCLMPKNNAGQCYLSIISRSLFIENIKAGTLFSKQRHIETQTSVSPALINRPQAQRRASQHVYHRGRVLQKRRL